MASTGSLFSQTLSEITVTKLEELAKRRESFEEHRGRILAAAEDNEDIAGSLVAISGIIKTAFNINTVDGQIVRGNAENAGLEIDLKNLDKFLAQAKYDPTVGKKTLQQWRTKLLRHVETQSSKFTYAWLYGALTMEWLSAKAPPAAPKDEDAEMEDYEHVAGAKRLEARAKWEEGVFKAKTVDPAAIEGMLRGLFEARPDDSDVLPKALEAIRSSVKAFETQLPAMNKFSVATLHWTIKGLLAGDLLTNEKSDALRDFDDNDTILREVADVLNLRLDALQDWSWGKEVLLEERKQLNGTFNIYLHEDLLQALFLQHIGVKWSVFWKATFRTHRNTKDVWKSVGSRPSFSELQRRQYYLGAPTKGPTVVSTKMKRHKEDYYVSQLLSSEYQETEGDEGDEEADFEQAAMAMQQAQQQPTQSLGRAKQTARKSTGGKAPRKQLASRSRFLSATAEEEAEDDDEAMGFGLFDGDDSDYESDIDDDKPRNPMAAKQGLLHLLSTDIIVHSRLRGEIAAWRSQIDNLYPQLPHGTVQAVLRYLGVSEKWIGFFVRFLEAPLRFMDDESAEPRRRKTGTPGSHVLSEVFSEVVLWCLDFLVNQRTDGEILWRMNDDFWFWGSHQKCTQAWATVNEFTQTMGMKTNEARTGSVRIRKTPTSATDLRSIDVGEELPKGQIRWGMLYLNPDSGRFEIDQAMVDTHIEELSRQLKDKGNSAFAWIQVFNSYASTFFTTNFGIPANCFGRAHVDAQLSTHSRIQNLVFTDSQSGGETGGGSFVEYLKGVVAHRQGVRNIPDGYFYWPTELGGLEIQSPFIKLLQVRDGVLPDAEQLFAHLAACENTAYRRAKREFEEGQPARKRRRTTDPSFRPENADDFMSYEEFTKYRDELNYGYGGQLVDVYKRLLQRPQQQAVESEANGPIHMALNGLPSNKLRSWYQCEPYWKYVAQLYGPDLIEQFGGFKIVDPGLLPMGMVSLFRSGRVKWQE